MPRTQRLLKLHNASKSYPTKESQQEHQYLWKGLRKHLTFVNSNYNILPTLSLKLLIQYQLSQREAFFRRDAYLEFLDGGFFLDFCQHRCEEDESDELGFYFCKPALQNLAKLLKLKFDWSLSKLILPEVDLFKPGKLNTPVIRAFSFVKQPVDYLLCGKEISFSRAIWLHFPISIRSHSTLNTLRSPISDIVKFISASPLKGGWMP